MKCPACEQDLKPCRYCGATSYFSSRHNELIQIHTGACVRTPILRLFEDAEALTRPDIDERTFWLLARRVVDRLHQLVARWPRERVGDVPEAMLAFGELCEKWLAANSAEGRVN